MSRIALLVMSAIVFGAASAVVAAPPDRVAEEWRVLLIIKPQTDLKLEGRPPIKARISQENIDAVTKAFQEHTPYWIRKVSDGRLRWKADVVVSSIPVTSVTPLGPDSFWLAPSNMAGDIRKHVPRSAYDGVFVYWRAVDDAGKGINAGFGWSIGPNENANHCGFSCVHHADTALWGRDSETTEVFLHEWLHQLEAFYSAQGIKLPKGGLHVDSSYGYKHHPTMYWKPWYRDFIAGDVREPDGARTGLGERAWQLGTIREGQQIYTPQYLTAELKTSNLLRNGSFEATAAADWKTGSWAGLQDAGRIIDGMAYAGKKSVRLSAAKPDDLHFRQTVPVQAGRKYLFCGWVKTDSVVAHQGGGVGANLSVLGGFERSSLQLTGSHDWTYVAFTFDAGDRTTVDLAARLGHHGSIATGTAWFDDLCVIEIPSRANLKRQ